MVPPANLLCPFCKLGYQKFHDLEAHMQLFHKDKFFIRVNEEARFSENVVFEKYDEALKGYVHTFKVSLEEHSFRDVGLFLNEIWLNLVSFLSWEVKSKKWIKGFLTLDCCMEKITDPEIAIRNVFFNSNCEPIMHPDFIASFLYGARDTLDYRVEQFTMHGSDYVLANINCLYIHIAKFTPYTGGSYIPLPSKFLKRRAFINIKGCSDKKCFYYCVLAQLYPLRRNDPRRNHAKVYQKLIGNLNMEGMPEEMRSQYVGKFADQNDLVVSVLGIDEETQKLYPLYCTGAVHPDPKRNIVLLYLNEGNGGHFILVSNLSRAIAERTKYNKKWFYCLRCINRFRTKAARDRHLDLCINGPIQRLIFYKNKYVEFKDYRCLTRKPFFLVADIECVVKPRHYCMKSTSVSFTEKISDLEMSAFAIVVFDNNGGYVEDFKYLGHDAAMIFLPKLLEICEKLKMIYEAPKPISPLTEAELELFHKTKNCQICSVSFDKPGVIKCKDHDHVNSPRLRFVLCQKCNQLINDRPSVILPVYIHNLNFDWKYIAKGITNNMSLTLLGKSLDHLTCIEVNKTVRLVDSMSIFPSSLQKITEMLLKSGRENFAAFDQVFHSYPDRDLLFRKLPYCYNYFSSFKVYDELLLPPPHSFNNSLSGESISSEEYDLLQRIWKSFNLANLKDFTLLYCLNDCLTLGACIAKFRDITYSKFKLDILGYVSLPSLAYSASLYWGKQKLQVVEDSEMFQMISIGMRGGYSGVNLKYFKANNKYLKSYDPTKPTSYIVYYDFTAMYSYCQAMELAIGGFEWLSNDELLNLEALLRTNDFSQSDMLVQVDLEYSEELKATNACQQFPLVIAHEKIEPHELSDLQKEMRNKHECLRGPIGTKLLASTKPKYNYVCLGSNLLFYLDHGVRILRVHRAFRWQQSCWGKKYVDLAFEMRQEADTPFMAQAAKTLACSAYGKFAQNIRNFKRFEVITTIDRAKKAFAHPNLQSWTVLNNDAVVVAKNPGICKVNRSSLQGLMITEKAKKVLLEFFYDVLCAEFPDVELSVTDTDSICAVIRTESML